MSCFVKYTLTCFFMFAPLVFFVQPLAAQDSSAKKITRTFFGQSSYYANKFNGRKTASGEIFNQNKMTCACNAVKLGTWLKVTNLRNGKWVTVKVNDRIHPGMKRITDLSSAAAKKLDFTAAGVTRVKVEVLGKEKPEE